MASIADPDEAASPWFLAIPAWAAAEPPVLTRASYDDQTAHTREALVRAARRCGSSMHTAPPMTWPT